MWKAEEIHRLNGWEPFKIAAKAELVRPLGATGGIEDRLRIVAFAEVQARDCFRWGAERFMEAPAEWRSTWRHFAEVENRHAQMLLNRMAELGFELGARAVTDKLTRLCLAAEDAELFLFCLASAEERGRDAGLILGEQMQKFDAESAAIFATIAREEEEHVEFSKAILSRLDYSMMRERAKVLDRSIGVSHGA